MKGFKVGIDRRQICGTIENGITGVVITCKGDNCRLDFTSLTCDGNSSYIWHSSDLEMGDLVHISFEDITETSMAVEKRHYNMSKEDSQKESLATYHRLKQELIGEGLL